MTEIPILTTRTIVPLRVRPGERVLWTKYGVILSDFRPLAKGASGSWRLAVAMKVAHTGSKILCAKPEAHRRSSWRQSEVLQARMTARAKPPGVAEVPSRAHTRPTCAPGQ